MTDTNFWLIRHALVEENARAILYGTLDVELCPNELEAALPTYRQLAARLPRPATWLVSPLSRTRRTAEAIFRAGYPVQPLQEEPGLIEQNLGDWQGLAHAAVSPLLQMAPHAFWPVHAEERPPGGESVADMLARVGPTMQRLADTHAGEDVVIVAHGGSIRAAVAHALGIAAHNALHLSIFNLSLTRLERTPEGWRVVAVNEIGL